MPPVVERLRAGQAEVEVLVARDADGSAALARQAVDEGVDVLAAMSGDGLVTSAAQAVVGTDVPLAVVPAGTGNDAARMLGVRNALQAAHRFLRLLPSVYRGAHVDRPEVVCLRARACAWRRRA